VDAKKRFEIVVRENADMLIAYIRSDVRDDASADKTKRKGCFLSSKGREMVGWKRPI